jgi:hypothetical protein
MPIYDRPVRLLLHDMIAELAPEPTSQFTRDDAQRWFANRYPKIKPGTVNAHLTQASTNNRTRLHYSPKHPDHDLLYQISQGVYRRYDRANDPAPITEDSSATKGESKDDDDGAEAVSHSAFAYERDLQNFLAKNLHLIEPGLTLYRDEEDVTGIEFDVGGRRIDILAVDRDGGLVVIELKVSRGYDRVVGQLLRYMQWIEENHADPGQNVRGVIVAREISEDLLLATKRINGVQLLEYEMSVQLKPVTT